MTREGAEKVREAVKAIYEQCEDTGSCGNCPLNNLRPGSGGFYECSFDTLVKAGGLDDSE